MRRLNGRIGAVIVAAGASKRMGGLDKVFAPLGTQPVLAYVVDVFEKSPLIDDIVVVLARKSLKQGRKLAAEHGWSKVVSICPGGLRRRDSVKQGLSKLADCVWVVIHDGARPCVSPELIEQGLTAAEQSGAATAGVPVKDTVKIVSKHRVVQQTPERRSLWMAQTPQVFRRDLLLEAYSQTDADVTDDSALVEKLGHKVAIYMGSYKNIKITTPEDLAVAELLLRNGQFSRTSCASA